jgi:hypothetical protein
MFMKAPSVVVRIVAMALTVTILCLVMPPPAYADETVGAVSATGFHPTLESTYELDPILGLGTLKTPGMLATNASLFAPNANLQRIRMSSEAKTTIIIVAIIAGAILIIVGAFAVAGPHHHLP